MTTPDTARREAVMRLQAYADHLRVDVSKADIRNVLGALSAAERDSQNIAILAKESQAQGEAALVSELALVSAALDRQATRADEALARVAELEAALKPFADAAANYDGEGDGSDRPAHGQGAIRISTLRTARALLTTGARP